MIVCVLMSNFDVVDVESVRYCIVDVELTWHSLIHVRRIDSTGSRYLGKSWSSVRASRNSDSLGRGVDREGSKRRPEPARRSSSEDELSGAPPMANLASRDRSFDRDSEGPEWFLREEVMCSKKRSPCKLQLGVFIPVGQREVVLRCLIGLALLVEPQVWSCVEM
ncbi:hypothetical protein B296_00034188 [Ensete ventricosum]|uniref:Uncharacterized protein n=1 Tax=Ensete ventricosum TaxID=4639 RepID=A0A426XZH2_ENSVE|nr:hypothetical protein B296_00034188 [Ensete ventricosum]